MEPRKSWLELLLVLPRSALACVLGGLGLEALGRTPVR